MGTPYVYKGDSVLYEVTPRVWADKDSVLIQLFRAHTSEAFGELQIPKPHVKTLIDLLVAHLNKGDGDE